jgi:hypothetical protein
MGFPDVVQILVEDGYLHYLPGKGTLDPRINLESEAKKA